MNYLILIGAVLLGGVFVLYKKPNKLYTRLLLAFSGAYLLSVTVLHLLPEVYSHNEDEHRFHTLGILILIGILIQSILESFSKGAEHGHVHLHSNSNTFPWLLFTSLSLHAFTEGLPIHSANDNLLWAIVVHKIPIAIILTTFFLHSEFSKVKTFLFLFIFSLMSPLGYYLGETNNWIQQYHQEITALIIGVFLHISTIILFESSENHKFNLQKFSAILLGILLTIFTLH
ncbi:ZIP family metal transporter [uncultured Tenacibaculum sp.]|uniref:ZIP family metal transporter n=1 Tax=uncultured Tenacibaculum sp. TaxID=174713 RepID=UPI00262ED591|nr:ZIP family metal transporter [uncultured Tenacibaculum sp.]